MLSLESENWNALQDAYGNGTAIPNLLRQIEIDKHKQSDPQSGPWFELWSRLCHQGSIYSASYAAVPFIVDSIPEEKSIIDMNFFLLPISIEIARNRKPDAKIPEEIETNYFAALKKIDDLATAYESSSNDNDLKKVIEATHLVTSGHFDQAEKVLDE